MNDFENAIEISGLTKKYDGFTLNDVSFNVPKGSIMGFIGQNGAGKTTTIKAILNIIKADSGKINIFGLDNTEHEYEIKENIAAVFDELPFHDSLSAKQLEIILGGIYKSWDNAKFKEYLERFCLPEKKPFGKFPAEPVVLFPERRPFLSNANLNRPPVCAVVFSFNAASVFKSVYCFGSHRRSNSQTVGKQLHRNTYSNRIFCSVKIRCNTADSAKRKKFAVAEILVNLAETDSVKLAVQSHKPLHILVIYRPP